MRNKIASIILVFFLLPLVNGCIKAETTTPTTSPPATTVTPTATAEPTTPPATTTPPVTTTPPATISPPPSGTAGPGEIPEIVIIPVDAYYQGIVDGIKGLQPVSIPDNLTDSGNKTGGEYDINIYFTVLTHLSMMDDYVLDYVYLYYYAGGSPVIYARHQTDIPYVSYEEFINQTGAGGKTENAHDIIAAVTDGDRSEGNKIVIDGTREGYFEYAVLQLLGNQFYLFWHANYNDTTIICGNEWLQSSLEDCMGYFDHDIWGYSPSGREITEADLITGAAGFDYEPKVEFYENTVQVTMVVFTKWGGFFRTVMTINKEYPHTIIMVESEPLLEFDCGVRF